MKLALMLVLAAISALAMWRIGTRRPLLMLLQPIAATLLYFTLCPPAMEQRAGTLVVATAGTTAQQLAAHRKDGPVLALPEAPPLPDVEAVPDLATALRRYPALSRVQVLGAGLGARDRDAVGARALAFEAAAPPQGLLELSAPSSVTVGSRWNVAGRVLGQSQARAELRDPSARLVMAVAPDAQGRFALVASASTVGRLSYRLDVIGHAGAAEKLQLPMQVRPGRQAQVWLLSGAPNPETKYLQRWALDAGLQVHSQASLGGGLHTGDSLPLDAQALAKLDLLVLDERAWRDLGPARRRLLRAAVDQGLGLMLRVSGPLGAAERVELREAGFAIGNDVGPVEVNLGDVPGPSLLRQPISAVAGDGLPLLRDSRGRALGLWRAHGRGRLGLWWLGETYRLVLAGRDADYGRIWSDVFATLARADAAPAPTLATPDPRPQQRAIICGVSAIASVSDSAGHSERLLPDPAAGAGDCAAWWPARAGWHRIQSGDAVLDVHVRAQDEAKGLVAQALHDETAALVWPGPVSVRLTQAVPGPRWPWFLGWLLLSALGWALERRTRSRTR